MNIEHIEVDGIDCGRLIGFSIYEAVHQHGSCELTFELNDEFTTDDLLQLDGKQISVKIEENLIFCGIVSHCKINSALEKKELNVSIISLSSQLSLSERKTKSYQSDQKKFSDIIGDITKDYESAQIDYWKEDDPVIQNFIYRDNLTDWEFLKMLAEKHGQVLFVNSKSDKIQVSIGVKAFQEFEDGISGKVVRQSVPVDFYKRLEQNTYEGARACYFTETEIQTFNPLVGVGCTVKYHDQSLVVVSSHILAQDTFFTNNVILRPAEGCRADAWDVMKYFDEVLYLRGKVLEATDNDLKIQFDCDEEQNKDEALKIPYESTMSNYMYSMPDEEDIVCVYVDRWRQAAMNSIRSAEVADSYDKRSFKYKTSALSFDNENFALAADKTEMSQADKTSFTTASNIVFSSKGDIIIQSAQGLVPDNQLTMVSGHMAGYAQYTAAAGQPPNIQFNPAGSTVGKVDAEIKNAGSAKEDLELSELAQELDKLTNRQAKEAENKDSGGGSGGTVKFEAKDSSLLQVKDSSLGIKGSDLNVKTPALIQVAYIPMAGGGTGSLDKFEGGNPNNRSEEITVEHGTEDRSRINENIEPTPDDKTISV